MRRISSPAAALVRRRYRPSRWPTSMGLQSLARIRATGAARTGLKAPRTGRSLRSRTRRHSSRSTKARSESRFLRIPGVVPRATALFRRRFLFRRPLSHFHGPASPCSAMGRRRRRLNPAGTTESSARCKTGTTEASAFNSRIIAPRLSVTRLRLRDANIAMRRGLSESQTYSPRGVNLDGDGLEQALLVKN
jgi:hypothetical protein